MTKATCGFLTLALLAAVGTGNAIPLTYSFDGEFTTGTEFSGEFRYDTSGDPLVQVGYFHFVTPEEAFGWSGGLDLTDVTANIEVQGGTGLRVHDDDAMNDPPQEFWYSLDMVFAAPVLLDRELPAFTSGTVWIHEDGEPFSLDGTVTRVDIVPEPATLTLLGIGIGILGLTRFRRKV